jgi:hypothetical protein
MKTQLHCQSMLLIRDLCFIYFQKETEVTVTGNIYINACIRGVTEETSPANAILGRIIHHQLEFIRDDNFLP